MGEEKVQGPEWLGAHYCGAAMAAPSGPSHPESRVQREQAGVSLNAERLTLNALLLSFIDLRKSEGLQQAARALRDKLPAAQLVAINTPETKAIEAQVTGVDRWITAGPEVGGAELIRQLRQLQPAAVCIVYRTKKPEAHLKLEATAALLGGKAQLWGAFAPDHSQLQPITRGRLWARVVGKLFLLLAKALVAAALAGYVAVVLLFAGLLARPGERLGTPAVGNRR